MIYVSIPLILWFLVFWHKLCLFLRDYVKPRIWSWLRTIRELFLNWQFALCYLFCWAVVHVPLYLMIILGAKFGNKVVETIGATIYGILWLPFCQENLMEIPVALWLKKKIFKKSKEVDKDLIDKLNS